MIHFSSDLQGAQPHLSMVAKLGSHSEGECRPFLRDCLLFCDSVPSIFHIHMIYAWGGQIHSKVKSKVCKCVSANSDLFSTV